MCKKRVYKRLYSVVSLLSVYFVFALASAHAAVWDVKQEVLPSVAEDLYWASFGSSVDISGDTAVIRWQNQEAISAVFVFEKESSTGLWAETQMLLPDDPAAPSWFGRELALDGDVLFVYEGFCCNDDSDAVYVFHRDAATHTWVKTQKIVADGEYERFGTSIAVKGHTAFIGAGRVSYVFEFDAASNLWVEKQKLNYGGHVAFDGHTAVIGSSVFKYNSEMGQWAHTQELPITGRSDVEGDTLVIGQANEGDFWEGAAYIYHFDHTAGLWAQTQRIAARIPVYDGGFGGDVAVDGNTILIGQLGTGGGEGPGGALYIFERNVENNMWEESQAVTDLAAWSVAIDRGSALVGRYIDLTAAPSAFLEVRRRNLNKLIEVQPDSSSLAYSSDLTGCPSWYAGKYLFDATLTNRSEQRRAPDGVPLSFLQMQIKTLTAGNQLAVDGELLVKGDRFAVSQQEGYADGILDVGESVTVPFEICLKKQRYFRFKVNIWGAIE